MILSIMVGIAALMAIFTEFFVPGGVMAAIGGVLFLFSVLSGFFFDPTFGLFWTVGLLVLLVGVIKLALHEVKKKGTYLSKTQEGYAVSFYGKEYIGKNAVVVSDLKPSGYVEVQGVKCQALSFGEYIRKGTAVKIVGERGSHLLVR